MYTKRDLKLLYLNFKNLKVLYFIPLIFLYVILPILNYSSMRHLGIDIAYKTIIKDSEQIIGLLSIWWIVLIFKEYIEGSSKELINIYTKNKFKEFTLITIWYILHCGIVFIFYSIIYDNVLVHFIKIIIEILFINGLCYFLIYLFNSTTVPLMSITMYNIISLFFQIKYINIYLIDKSINIYTYIPILCIAIVFITLGYFKNKSYEL